MDHWKVVGVRWKAIRGFWLEGWRYLILVTGSLGRLCGVYTVADRSKSSLG